VNPGGLDETVRCTSLRMVTRSVNRLYDRGVAGRRASDRLQHHVEAGGEGPLTVSELAGRHLTDRGAQKRTEAYPL
jgi:hypothetical protein